MFGNGYQNGHGDQKGHGDQNGNGYVANSTVGSADDRVVFVPYKDAYATGFEDMRRRVPNIAKIRTYAGWQPQKSLNHILQDVIAEFAEEQAVAVTA